jgi:hypothetical protein
MAEGTEGKEAKRNGEGLPKQERSSRVDKGGRKAYPNTVSRPTSSSEPNEKKKNTTQVEQTP